MRTPAIRAALLLIPVSLCAQWFNIKTPGIPRTSDGKPDLTAPVPRTADGKPDLSGFWGTNPFPSPGAMPYFIDLFQELKDEAIFKPEAEALFQKRAADLARDWPVGRCLPGGPMEALASAYRIIQSPTILAMLFTSEPGDDYRQIFLDGRELPQDPNPTWHGYSVGHWEGDTLVVESTGFNDRSWLDGAGHPHSEKLRATERFHRVDFGHIQYQITLDDPETFRKPFSLTLPFNYLADTEMLESVCEDRDGPHMVGKTKGGLEFSAAFLTKYAGVYDAAEVPPGFQRELTVSLMNSQLFLGDLPLTPLSETRFDWFGGPMIDFSIDPSGAVTGITRKLGKSDATWIRKP